MKIIKADFNFEHFESMLNSVHLDRELSIPTHMHHDGSWGMEVSFTQLLLTWARIHEFPKLSVYVSDIEPTKRNESLAELGKRLHSITALYLATRVVSRQGTQIPKEEYWRHCLPTLEAMRQCDIYSESQVSETYPRRFGAVAAQFICLHGTPYEFPHSLYDTPTRLDLLSRSQFLSLLYSVVGKDPYLGAFFERQKTLARSLATILFELFQNTNDHAYENIKGNPFERNIRAFLVKDHSGELDDGTFEAMRGSDIRFNKYLKFCEARFREKGRTRYHFLEISVVDGGVGLAQQFSRTPLEKIPVVEEGKITVNCFKQGISSKGPKSRGEGLYEVWNSLRELRGFIRLRTGRVSLFQTFQRGLKTPTAFKSWNRSKTLCATAGTAVTIIIPCID